MKITNQDIRMFRQRAKTELKSGCDCGRLRWDDIVESLCDEVEKLRYTLDYARQQACAILYNLPVTKTLLRNCERFETEDDAKKEFNYLWNFVWKRGGGYVDEREYRSEYDKWLFAPIQEGETNGSR